MATVFDMYNATYASIDKTSVVNVESQLLHSLEGLVDATSLEEVLQALSTMCGQKAEHVASNWQDAKLARAWASAEGAIGILSTNKHIAAVS